MPSFEVEKMLKIEKLIEGRLIEGKPRAHLGASELGEECRRKLWYTFRWVKFQMFEPRTLRLFQRGHNEEPIIIKDLKAAGVKVLSTQESASFCSGYGGASNDGIIRKLPGFKRLRGILECKTANDANFSKYKIKGVRGVDSNYYGQSVVYMHLFKVDYTLFVMVNKNNDERYYEIIKPNEEFAKGLIKKAKHIIMSEKPPMEISDDINYYRCGPKWCHFREVCRFGHSPNRNCRTCNNVDLVGNGSWVCSKNGKVLDYDAQLKGCKKHKMLKFL